MSKTIGQDYYLGTVGMDLLCQDPYANCCKALPFSLSQPEPQWISPIDFSAISVAWDQSKSTHKVIPTLGWAGMVVSMGSLYPLEEPEAQRSPLCTVLCALRKEQCGQWVAMSLTLLMLSVLVSVVQGELQPHSRVLGFSQWYLVL